MNYDVRSFILIVLVNIYRKLIRVATLMNCDVTSSILIVLISLYS